ncbi:MAG: hypothetical protein AVDCRST_MAG02-4365 [uncultured Rubrobacteraceae bacterium]|uniref:Yip1 domain-containing protein n=1 Tax=uncultured Rubrobacteraceae bacterium TaxID=349277 RepID=A0A6J4RT67_9ACTN|nr:MAG: hypothetical protein AVDCRST_MAG02-4365 [uncultured Rubrobacteraceae bacterium]
MAKRGYTRDTIRGGASDWDVSRPFSSYVRLFSTLLVHPVRFFDLLPKVPDVRAPALFLAFSGLPAAVVWFFLAGLYPALVVLVLPLPVSVALAGLYHAGALGGRYGFGVTWRTLAYPLGFVLPLAAVPVVRWAALAWAAALLVPLGVVKTQEVPAWRGISLCAVAATLTVVAAFSA